MRLLFLFIIILFIIYLGLNIIEFNEIDNILQNKVNDIIPVNVLKSFQEKLNNFEEPTLEEIENYKQCNILPMDDPNVILGHDPTISDVVSRQNLVRYRDIDDTHPSVNHVPHCYNHFHLENGSCVQNECNCPNGISKTGTDCKRHNSILCESCNNGYHMDTETHSCKLNTCKCTNGRKAIGENCDKNNIEKCIECDPGYTLTSDNKCSKTQSQNQCTYEHLCSIDCSKYNNCNVCMGRNQIVNESKNCTDVNLSVFCDGLKENKFTCQNPPSGIPI